MNVSKEFVPYLNVTTHLESSPDQGILEAKGGTGFPTLFFIEPETGAVLNEPWWPEDEDTVREALAAATARADELKALVRKAEAQPDDQALQAQLKIELAMMYAGDTPLADLMRLAETPGLDPELKEKFLAWSSGRRVLQILQEAEERSEAEQGFYALLKEGVRLPPDHELAEVYYSLGLDGAVAEKDEGVARAAYEAYAALLQQRREQYPKIAERIDKALAEAKAKLDGIGAESEDTGAPEEGAEGTGGG